MESFIVALLVLLLGIIVFVIGWEVNQVIPLLIIYSTTVITVYLNLIYKSINREQKKEQRS